MVKLNILAGGRVAFISSYIFDSSLTNLTLIQNNPSGQGSSWIEKSAVNPNLLYAINDRHDNNTYPLEGFLQTFTIFPNSTLSENISYSSTHGSSPVHILALPTGEVSVVNPGVHSQNIIIFSPDGNQTIINFPFSSCLPYQTVPYNKELLVPDLGYNTIWRLIRNQENVFEIGGEIKQLDPDSPRRIAIFNNTLITLHDTLNTITSQSIPPLGQNNSDIISRISIGNTNQPLYPSEEVLIPLPNQDFPSTFVYTSNRNNTMGDSIGDSIIIYSLQSDGKLELVNQFFTELKGIQGMRFGGDSDRYLVAGGRHGGGVIVLERTGNGDNLNKVASINGDGQVDHTSFVVLSV